MVEILLIIFAFALGVVCGYILRIYLIRRKYIGIINIIETPEKTVYSLDLNGEPEDIDNRRDVTFKVNHPEAPSQ